MESSDSSADISHNARLLGLLSDTHGQVKAAAAGIATLRAAGAQFLIHCGDVGGENIFDLMAGIPSAFVWGNNDFDRESLKNYASHLGIQCGDEFLPLRFGEKKVAVTHGDNPALIRQVAAGTDYQYLFVGHSHIPVDEIVGKVRIVNPGALHRAAKKTVAVVDLEKDLVRHLIVQI